MDIYTIDIDIQYICYNGYTKVIQWSMDIYTIDMLQWINTVVNGYIYNRYATMDIQR